MAGRRVVPRQGTLTPESFAWLLRDLRGRAGFERIARLATEVPYSASLISKVENLERVPHRDFAVDCDRVLGTDGQLARAWDDVAWHAEVDHPDWFRRYADIEARAISLREYQVSLISGLLQTPAYAESLFRAQDETATDEAISKRVAARLSRQSRFMVDDDSAPYLVVVLDEAAIRREVGGPQVMYRQLAHVLTLARRPNITIQVAPFKLGARTRSGTSLTLATLPDDTQWLYSESVDKGHFSADPNQLVKRSRAYDRLRADALSADASAQLVRRVTEGLLNMTRPTPDLSTVQYFKSSYSDGNGGQCIETSHSLRHAGLVPVRDSKDPTGAALVFSASAWQAFVTAAAEGQFGGI